MKRVLICAAIGVIAGAVIATWPLIGMACLSIVAWRLIHDRGEVKHDNEHTRRTSARRSVR
jgi:hypothetical protein